MTPLLLAVLLVAAWPAPAQAHGEGSHLELAPNRAQAGEQVDVVGHELAPNSAYRAVLITSTGELPVAEAQTDEVGDVTFSFVLPQELSPRVYELRVIDESGVFPVSSYVTVVEEESRAGIGGQVATPVGELPMQFLLAAVLAISGLGLLFWALRQPKPRER